MKKTKVIALGLAAAFLAAILFTGCPDGFWCSDSATNCNNKNRTTYCGDSGCDALYKFIRNGKCTC